VTANEWDEIFVYDILHFSSPPVVSGTDVHRNGSDITVVSSSIKFKNDVKYRDIDPIALDFINDLKPASWIFKDYDRISMPPVEDFGMIAEDYEGTVQKFLGQGGIKEEWALYYEYDEDGLEDNPKKKGKKRVKYDLNTRKLVNYKSKFHESMMVMAVQELSKQDQEQQVEIDELRSEIETLKAQVAILLGV